MFKGGRQKSPGAVEGGGGIKKQRTPFRAGRAVGGVLCGAPPHGCIPCFGPLSRENTALSRSGGGFFAPVGVRGGKILENLV